jgi:hypothetical protein
MVADHFGFHASLLKTSTGKMDDQSPRDWRSRCTLDRGPQARLPVPTQRQSTSFFAARYSPAVICTK